MTVDQLINVLVIIMLIEMMAAIGLGGRDSCLPFPDAGRGFGRSSLSSRCSLRVPTSGPAPDDAESRSRRLHPLPQERREPLGCSPVRTELARRPIPSQVGGARSFCLFPSVLSPSVRPARPSAVVALRQVCESLPLRGGPARRTGTPVLENAAPPRPVYVSPRQTLSRIRRAG